APETGSPAARRPEAVPRDARVDLAHPRERVPGRGFADVQVGIAGERAAALRGDGDARAEPDRGERPQRLELGVLEAAAGIVAGDQRARGGRGVRLAEDGVRDGDRRLTD